MNTNIQLTPTQQLVAAGVEGGIPAGGVFVLEGGPGKGKTTILRKLHSDMGGAFIGMREFVATLTEQFPAAVEGTFLRLIEDSLIAHDIVFVDDLHLVARASQRWYRTQTYILDAALTALFGEARVLRKKLVFGVEEDETPWPVRLRAYCWKIGELTVEDYAAICHACLHAEVAGALDYAAIHRFAPKLNLYQVENACRWLGRREGLDTEGFIEYLQSTNMASNVEAAEVPPVDWKDLKGADDVVRALEAKIALPFENDGLAAGLGLKPKRGVLLAGPPGTGKTTIGRALAHRLKSKFFLIDGTAIAGTGEFYEKVDEVFEAAQRNAPAVVFIDDADVIFENDHERGLYRYLLTKLDGLESASAERVCVMMTAMNVGSLPAALLRSGRVELWLETRLPDADARAAILEQKLANLPDGIRVTDFARLAAASHGLTGADLKAVVEDGKLDFAHDAARGKTPRPAEEYFLHAIEMVRANRRNYARSKPPRLTEGVKIGFGMGNCE
jgi:ATP-dependent 26S proteasome regulatory subunit